MDPTHQDAFAKDAYNMYYVVASHVDEPVCVGAVRVEGADRTRAEFVRKAVAPVFKTTTLSELITALRQTAYRLEKLDIFEHVDVNLDNAKLLVAADHPVDVSITVKEAARSKAATGFILGDNEAGAYGSVRFPSVFGGAEKLEVRASVATRTSSDLLTRFSVPLGANPSQTVGLSAFRTVCSFLPSSSYEQTVTGVTLNYRFTSRLGAHEIAFLSDKRRIRLESVYPRLAGAAHGTGDKASASLHDEAKGSIKHAIRHTFLRDTRDNALTPSKGHHVKFIHEFAGLGGDVKFVKHDGEAGLTVSPASRIRLTTKIRGGFLIPLEGQKSKISDRFTLGGPFSVRGFQTSSLGPRDGVDALGGELYWAAGASLMCPLSNPKESVPWYAHTWINAGKLLALQKDDGTVENARSLLDAPAVSIGVGLACRFRNVRFEMNYAVPLMVGPSDKPKRGIQFAFGFDML